MEIEQAIAICQAFALKHKVIFDSEGTCGFGRECVGFSSGSSWIDYNPVSYPDYEDVPEVFDKRLFDITPNDAYHKHNCLAVLGRGETAIIQLAEWATELEKLGATVVDYATGATGLQAVISGWTGRTIKIPKPPAGKKGKVAKRRKNA